MQPPRFYYPHHFIFYPLVLTSAGISLYYMFTFKEQSLLWLAFAGNFLLLAWLSYMVRQHYALTNQDRIIRLEMRFRYFVLTQKRLEELESLLTFKQIAALRFASDEELPALVQRVLKEKLSPSDIKTSIKNWLCDDMRV